MEKQEKDKCVLCGKETDYEVTTPIELRQHYIECAGQLCKDCYHETFKNQK